MKNIKVGDKVKVVKNLCGIPVVEVGLIYEVCSLSEYSCSLNTKLYKVNMWFDEIELVEPKQDLRELLKVGHRVVFRLKNVKDVQDCVISESIIKEIQNQSEDDILWVDEIYRKKYNGIKPMEWVLVWKREEELFTLRLKGNVRLPYYAKGNSQTKYDYTFRKNSKPVNEEKYQVRFTQEDIEKLPKELVALLEKENVQ